VQGYVHHAAKLGPPPDCSSRSSEGWPSRRLTFDMRGMRQQAKPDVACPLDGRVRPLLHVLGLRLDFTMPSPCQNSFG